MVRPEDAGAFFRLKGPCRIPQRLSKTQARSMATHRTSGVDFSRIKRFDKMIFVDYENACSLQFIFLEIKRFESREQNNQQGWCHFFESRGAGMDYLRDLIRNRRSKFPCRPVSCFRRLSHGLFDSPFIYCIIVENIRGYC